MVTKAPSSNHTLPPAPDSPTLFRTIDKESVARLGVIFQAKKLRDMSLPEHGHIIEISTDTSISTAARTLAEARIQSAPVRDVNAPDNGEWWEKYTGLLDMVQLVEYLLEEAMKEETAPFLSCESVLEHLNTTTVAALKTTDNHHSMRHLPTTATLLDAMTLIGKHNARRIAVVDSIQQHVTTNHFAAPISPNQIPATPTPQNHQSHFTLHPQANGNSNNLSPLSAPHTTPNSTNNDGEGDESSPGRLHNFLTASTVMKEVVNCLEKGEVDLSTLTLHDLNLDVPSLQGVLQVNTHDPIIDAFGLIHNHRVTGVAVVGEQGRLVGIVNASDIHFVVTHPDAFRLACDPHSTIAHFFEWRESSHNEPVRVPVTCSAQDTLDDLIRRMVEVRAHRLYVVDDNEVPTSEITMTDIARILIPDEPKQLNERQRGMSDCWSAMSSWDTHSHGHK